MIVRCIKARGTRLTYLALFEVVDSYRKRNFPLYGFLLPDGVWYDSKRFEIVAKQIEG